MMPYPPSFSRRAASSMEPAIGASTWALGSQRCRPYRGALTMKAISRAKLDTRPVQEVGAVGCDSLSMGKYNVPIWLCRCRMAINSGRELARV